MKLLILRLVFMEEIMNCIEGDTIQDGTALVEEDMAKTILGEKTEFRQHYLIC